MTTATFVPGPAPTRLTRLRDLPRRGLVAGGGHVREICGQWGAGGELHWMLQLVELRGPEGVLHLPPDAAHVLAGIGGPQVGVGPGAAVGLRKERVLHYAGAFLELRRPQLRAAELSRVLVLSSVPARATPSLVFSDLHGTTPLPADVRAVVVRSGRVSAGGSTATAMEALVLPDAARSDGAVASGPGAVADDARVLMVVG
ncbi:hypothetical protein [Microbacterium azadirachtae]|uniref:hypothetical protein n=1 Tax=Microbacterium azadirachtae TaxID=582680 RepID=UPI00088631B8|nr:hypothetical protein [Microbacterium azadirachtae]SDL88064.1 hypothetical protein SAMN04488593_2033 [Microbacterium azadirachtae]SEG19258.1 hypothetical protein SAMN04488594_2146 [Microbacterium azadirachtae]SEG21585.1 hypothetical protein SAMN04488592_2156 [Microbacterium azadirachtae]